MERLKLSFVTPHVSESLVSQLPYLATLLFTSSFNCCGCGYVDITGSGEGRFVKRKNRSVDTSLSANDISSTAVTSAASKGHQIRGVNLVSCSEAGEVKEKKNQRGVEHFTAKLWPQTGDTVAYRRKQCMNIRSSAHSLWVSKYRSGSPMHTASSTCCGHVLRSEHFHCLAPPLRTFSLLISR